VKLRDFVPVRKLHVLFVDLEPAAFEQRSPAENLPRSERALHGGALLPHAESAAPDPRNLRAG
jgi:hypothetical protein